MEFILILFCILLGLGFIFILLRLFLIKRQLRDIIKQNQFIQKEKTNLPITSSILNKEIKDLIISINDLLETHRQFELKMTQANKSFKNSITGISHDLRTPLTSASGYIQMLQDYELPEEKKAEYLQIISQRVQIVRRLLDQLFEFARIEANEMILSEDPINLGNVLRDTLVLFYNDFGAKKNEPHIQIPDTPFIVIGDADAFKRIFSNILSNAITHGEGPFCINTDVFENKVIISIDNTSHSITQKDLPHVFERFYTTDTSRSRKTTGLGLSIAKSLTQKMGGTIGAVLIDSTFKIQLEFELKK